MLFQNIKSTGKVEILKHLTALDNRVVYYRLYRTIIVIIILSVKLIYFLTEFDFVYNRFHLFHKCTFLPFVLFSICRDDIL